MVERFRRLLGGVDALAPIEKRRRMHAPQLQPALDVFQRDEEILGMCSDVPGDALPMQSAILPEEVMIIAGWIIESHEQVRRLSLPFA